MLVLWPPTRPQRIVTLIGAVIVTCPYQPLPLLTAAHPREALRAEAGRAAPGRGPGELEGGAGGGVRRVHAVP